MNRRNFFTLGTPVMRGDRAVRYMGDGGTQNPPLFMRRSGTGLEPWTATGDDTWNYVKAAHLLRRCMPGPTQAEINKAVADGLDATVTGLLNPFTPPLTLIDDWAGQDPQVKPAATDAATIQAFQAEVNRKRSEIHKWWLLVMGTSPVSIQERMTLFWHNHFTSEMQVVNYPEFMFTQNQLLRSSGLGNFKQFVKDITKDMAMLLYLDGAKNSKRGNKLNINENYARELQELFTMGVVDWDGNPNYTQTDVSEAARALSGYTITPSAKGANYLSLNSQFLQALWDSGQKTFLGKTGAWKADDVVDIIFSERADQVAKFICGKIYRAFVYDVIDPVVVTAMAETFRSSNWEIKPVMQQLLRSAHFFDNTNIGALDKSPAEFVIDLVRGLGLGSVPDFQAGNTRGSDDLRTRITSYGMTLFAPPNVKGWPGGRTWISTSTLPLRQKFGLDIMDAAIKAPGKNGAVVYTFDPIAFARLFSDPGDIHKLSTEMAAFLLNTPPSDMEAQQLYSALLDGGVDYEWDINDAQQRPAERIRKFMKVAFQLAKYQLY